MRFLFWSTFEALQEVCVPAYLQFSSDQKLESRRIITGVLNSKDAATRFKIILFLTIIEGFCLSRYLRRLSSLSFQERQGALFFFFDSKIKIFRAGFWGLNTLCKMGVYGQPSVYLQIGYKLKEVPHDHHH